MKSVPGRHTNPEAGACLLSQRHNQEAGVIGFSIRGERVLEDEARKVTEEQIL